MATNQRSAVPALLKPFNNLVRPFAGRFFYALLRHTGRRSGQTYTTPVVAWLVEPGIIVPVTWGTTCDWYRNIVAAGGGEIQINGRWYRGDNPQLIDRSQAHALLPLLTRLVAGFFPIKQFLLLRRVEA